MQAKAETGLVIYLSHTVDSQEDVSWENGPCSRCSTCAATRGCGWCGGEVANAWQLLFSP